MSFKRSILWVTLFLIIFIAGLFIWLVLPGPEVILTRLIPTDAFAYVSLKISLNGSGVSDLVNNLRLIANNPAVKIRERFFIKFIIPFFLPMEAATTFILNSKTKNTDYLIFIKNNRLARLFRLSALLKFKPIKGNKYIIFNDTIIVAKQFSLTESALNSYKQRPVSLTSRFLDNFRTLKDTKDAVLFINNGDSYFSQFINNLERKNTYIIFPTVNSIEWISGYLDIVNADKIKGSLIFKYKELTDVEAVKGDIHFLFEIFHRCFRANSLNFIKEMIVRNDSIDLNFEISGLRAFMANFLNQKGVNIE